MIYQIYSGGYSMKSVKYVVAMVAVVSVLVFSCASSGGGGGAAKEEVPVVPVFTWNFDDPDAGTLGWVPNDTHWDYRGTVEVSRDDTTLGKPMLRVDLDYSRDAGSEWSEVKIRCPFPEPIEIAKISRFNCDLYYNPEYKSRGNFKGKVFAMEGTREKSTAEATLKEEDADNGWKKAKITFRVLRAPGNMDATMLGIVGYKTNYKGPVLLDNIYWD
jgi:hypothetical protein